MPMLLKLAQVEEIRPSLLIADSKLHTPNLPSLGALVKEFRRIDIQEPKQFDIRRYRKDEQRAQGIVPSSSAWSHLGNEMR
jgi:hypothetical protein